jgi:acetyl esterase/lipase
MPLNSRALLLSLLALAAASTAEAQGCQTTSGITYGTYVDGNGQTQPLLLDLLQPTAGGPAPLVIWIHGGGWLSGSRTPLPAQVSALCGRGYAVASVDYRLTQTAIWPAQIQDVKGAVRFLRANAGSYSLDPGRFAAWGTSAGGHLAAVLGTTGDVPTATVGNVTVDLEGTTGGNLGTSSRVQAAIDWYGATDVLQMSLYASSVDHDARLSAEGKLLGGFIQLRPELAATANPITFVSADDPPFLVMHGTVDDTNPFNQSELLVDALRASGVPVTFVPVQGVDHGFMDDVTAQRVYDFLASLFANPPAATVAVAATAPNAGEAGGHGTFTLTRTGSAGSMAAALAVRWVFKGTAELGVDYNAPMSAVFPAGAGTVTVDLTPIEDSRVEGAETAVLTLIPDAAYRIDPGQAAATATIGEDDSAAGLPAVTLTASTPGASESGTAGAFTVTRTGSTSAALTVSYAVSGTAANGADYAALSGSVTIPAGQGSAAVTVAPLADATPEPAETVILTLVPTDRYAVGSPATASVALSDVRDGSKPIVSASATDPTASEQGGDSGAFTLSRTGSTAAALTVDLVLSGSAQPGTDYAPVATPVTFPAGASRIQVTISPLNDAAGEMAETVHLAAAGPAILSGPYVATVTLTNPLPVAGFYTLPPCRLADTRQAAGPQGGPPLAAGATRVFTVGGVCGVPAEATAISVNLTVANPGAAGFLTLYPPGVPRPQTSVINFRAGQVRGNNAIVPVAGMPPGLAVFYSGAAASTVDVILDVNGYFR